MGMSDTNDRLQERPQATPKPKAALPNAETFDFGAEGKPFTTSEDPSADSPSGDDFSMMHLQFGQAPLSPSPSSSQFSSGGPVRSCLSCTFVGAISIPTARCECADAGLGPFQGLPSPDRQRPRRVASRTEDARSCTRATVAWHAPLCAIRRLGSEDIP